MTSVATIAKPEPVPVGDALRARVHYLVAQHHAMVVQTQFADAKAAALLTLSGLAAIRAPVPHSPDLMQIALIITLFSTVLLCLLSVIPRYGASGRHGADRFTWVALSEGRQDAMHADFVQNAEFPELLSSLAASNVGGARVLQRKFRLIRFAFLCGIAAVLLAGLLGLRQTGLLPSSLFLIVAPSSP